MTAKNPVRLDYRPCRIAPPLFTPYAVLTLYLLFCFAAPLILFSVVMLLTAIG